MPARAPLLALRHPLRLLSGILLVTVAACTWLSFSGYRAYLTVENSHRRLARHEHLHGEILRLDEALTMSATMATASGEPRWEDRYQRLAPELDAAITEAKGLAPIERAFAAAAQADAANVKLVNMETRAFALVRAGDLRAARALLDGPEYRQQKELYADGMAEFIDDSRAYLDDRLRRARASGLTALSMTIAAMIALILITLQLLRLKVIRPLRHMAAAAADVSAGRLDGTVAVTSDDAIGALERAFNEMVERLRDQRVALEQKNVDLEQNLATQEQLFATQERLFETVKQLSTPIMPVAHDVLVLPIIGHVDPERASDITHELLKGIVELRARVAILDVTGIAALDESVIDSLLRTVRAAELLGTEVMLVGISPAMARVIVELGVDLGSVKTFRDLRSAIEATLRRPPGLARVNGR
jgi:rsbT co-antagonist protein RsbR